MGDSLRIGLSALQAQRRALEIHGQNVANANTVGYSRQRVELEAIGDNVAPALFSTGQSPGGVRATDITRIRDAFLDTRARAESQVEAELEQSVGALQHLETVVGEPSDTGLAAQVSDFLSAWDDLANRPGDVAARSAVLARAKTLVSGFASLDANVGAYGADSLERLRSSVTRVNGLATSIATLNDRAMQATAAGIDANELLDERSRQLDELSTLTGATLRDGANGVVDVYVGGIALVRGNRVSPLAVAVDGAGVAHATWQSDGRTATPAGAIAGNLAVINDIVPRYRAAFTAVADTLRTEVNTAHRAGFGLDGVGGRDFFTPGAGPLAIDAAVLADPGKLAASASPTATGDGTTARGLAALTGAADAYQTQVVSLAVESQSSSRRFDIQQLTAGSAKAASQNASGVNIDEEMVDMMGAQHAYEAAARLLTSVDQMLDVLINRTGLVGR